MTDSTKPASTTLLVAVCGFEPSCRLDTCSKQHATINRRAVHALTQHMLCTHWDDDYKSGR